MATYTNKMNEGHVWASSAHPSSIKEKKARPFYSFSQLIIQLINVKCITQFQF